MSEPYPLSLILQDEAVAIIGGGNVAERKVLSLLDTGAHLTVIAPEATDLIKDLAAKKKLTLLLREVIDEDISGKLLVFAATSSDDVNRWVSQVARRRGILVNCVDTPEECTFYVPSFFRRGSLTFSISTGGKVPALAKRLRKKLQASFDEPYAKYVDLLAQARKEILKNQSLTAREKKEVLDGLINSDLLRLFREGREEEAPQYMNDFIENTISRDTVNRSKKSEVPGKSD